MNNQDININSSDQIKQIIFPYLIKWKYYLLSFIIILSIAFFKLRYRTDVYTIKATLLVRDENKGDANNQLESFQNLGFDISGVKSKLENEIEILKSRTLSEQVICNLKLNLNYFEVGKFKEKDLYNESPLKINFVKGDSSIYKKKWNY